MRIQTKIEPIDRDIELMLSAELSPEAQSRALADFARQSLLEAQEHNRQALGMVPPHETYVDGHRGAPIDSVRVGGTVIFEFELVNELLVWIAEQLARHSPFLTGAYTASHILFADGVEIAPEALPPPAREYVYMPTVLYARKIEWGLSPQAPDGVYEVVALMASRRFGNVAKIRFTYRALASAVSSAPKSKRAADKAARQPAILVSLE